MEDKVKSLKDAIDITLYKLNYNNNDTNIIKKLILNALSGKSDYFTRTNKAREYVSSLTRKQILKELMDNFNSSDIDEIINNYINKNYKQSTECREIIREKSDLDKISKKIRYFNIVSNDDNDFYDNVWQYFSKKFVESKMKNKEKITSEEYLYDLEEAALCVAEQNRDHATVLKKLDPMSNELTKNDAITIVDEYVYQNKKDELDYYIKNNSVLSGLLQQNLFEYLNLRKEEKMDLRMINDTDNIFDNYNHNHLKEQLIFQIMNGQEIKNFISSDDLKIIMMQNSICMYILFKEIGADFKPLTNNKTQNEMILNENIEVFNNLSDNNREILKMIYMGDSEVSSVKEINSRKDISNAEKLKLIEKETKKAIIMRKITNDQIAASILKKGLDTTEEDIMSIINSYGSNIINYLTNMYIISRSTKDNREYLNDTTYRSTNEQAYVFNLLGSIKIEKATNIRKAA